ncbi:hypothetical protein Nham_3908 [Nitrobacter hamburgensis X14]|uniref:Uncharacterized protein n=1 Tax=Nitrobacter hamburgensis (strain DSM 10229 / NCIMB 13809 / X14) TaxID=323097 RepID=Q1QGP9_NITHX|nr:hypothetical protein [Nitrobacter hamburgensis]ABE64598.1 hypothetical protein Nham_3908 [Nitrobacter hamburgensis X14]
MTSRYAELQVTSHFSFLRGASSCEELFAHERQRRIILAAGMVAVQGRIQREGEVGRIVNAEVPRPFKRRTL